MHEYPNRINKNSKEIGCVLSEKYWGQGLMPEALKEVIKYIVERWKILTMYLCEYIENKIFKLALILILSKWLLLYYK